MSNLSIFPTGCFFGCCDFFANRFPDALRRTIFAASRRWYARRKIISAARLPDRPADPSCILHNVMLCKIRFERISSLYKSAKNGTFFRTVFYLALICKIQASEGPKMAKIISPRTVPRAFCFCLLFHFCRSSSSVSSTCSLDFSVRLSGRPKMDSNCDDSHAVPAFMITVHIDVIQTVPVLHGSDPADRPVLPMAGTALHTVGTGQESFQLFLRVFLMHSEAVST